MITEENKNRLITLESANSLYGDLRGRILDVKNSLGGEIDSLSDTFVSTSDFNNALEGKANTDDLKSKGSNKQPVYFNDQGQAVAINHTIEANVPSDAKFTDTTYAAGPGLLLQGSEFVVDTTVVSTIVNTNKSLATKADLVSGKIPADQLPSYVDDVLEYSSLSAFPTTGEAGKVYVAKDTNFTYRWSGTQYTKLNDVDLTNYYTKSEIESALASKFDSNNIATYDGSGTVDTDIVKMMMTVKNSLSTNPT